MQRITAKHLQAHEGDDAAIDVPHGYRGRHGSLHVEQRKSERWRQECRLEVHRQQHRVPQQDVLRTLDEGAEIGLGEDRREHRHHDEADLEEIEEEPHDEDEGHDERERLPARVDAEFLENLYYDVVTAESAEDVREQGGAEDDEEHQPVRQAGAHDHIVHRLEVELAGARGEHEGTDAPDAGRFRRRRPAAKYRTQYEHDQERRWREAEQHHPHQFGLFCGPWSAPSGGAALGLRYE